MFSSKQEPRETVRLAFGAQPNEDATRPVRLVVDTPPDTTGVFYEIVGETFTEDAEEPFEFVATR